MKEKEIDYRFKLLYAFAIIMVVTGHCDGGSIDLLNDWFPVYGHHLSLFMFASGYFYREDDAEHLGKYICKKAKRLLIPLWIWNFVYAAIVYFMKRNGFEIAPLINGHQFIYNLGSWYIGPLFMVAIYHAVLRKILKSVRLHWPESVLFILNLIIGIIGIQLAIQGCNQQVWLPVIRMMYFIPFYSFGIFYRKSLENYDKIPSIWYFTFIFALKIGISIICRRMPVYSVAWCNDFIDGPVMPFIVGFLGIAFWFRVARNLEPVLGKVRCVNLLADNAFSIMVNQIMGFMIVKTMFAMINRYTVYCSDFDWHFYKTDVWYYYLPGGNPYFLIIYAMAGLIFPVVLQKVIDWSYAQIKYSLKL